MHDPSHDYGEESDDWYDDEIDNDYTNIDS